MALKQTCKQLVLADSSSLIQSLSRIHLRPWTRVGKHSAKVSATYHQR